MTMPNAVRKTKLTDAERQQVLAVPLMCSTNGRLKHGDVAAVAEAEGFTTPPSLAYGLAPRRTRRALAALLRLRGDCAAGVGRTTTLQPSSGFEVSTYVERSTVRSAAAACGIAPATLFRQFCLGRLRVHTSVTKPMLTEANKAQRLQFALSHIQRDTMLFDNMLDTVHVDEKLFYITQPTRRFLLLPDEVAPVRRLCCRRYITRVMVLAAVARPRYDPVTNQFFDGKLGSWPFVERVPAQRSSRHRPAGTLVTKDVSVTKKTYREMLISNLLPALRELWPASVTGTRIVVQQDNAPAHIPEDDAAFMEAARASGCNVVLRNQSPNSPDMSCNDLNLFSAVQARQRKKRSRTIDELIEAVVSSYWELSMRTMNAAFLSLQGSLDDCIAQAGDNNYKPRHMKREKLRREGRLPVSIRCCEHAEKILTDSVTL